MVDRSAWSPREQRRGRERRAGHSSRGSGGRAAGVAERRSWARSAVAQLSGALRLVSADAADDARALRDPHLIAAGKVTSSRWRRCSSASATAGRRARTRSSPSPSACWSACWAPGGFHLRVSDTDYLHRPSRAWAAWPGQAACLRYLREVLNHFLGDAGHGGGRRPAGDQDRQGPPGGQGRRRRQGRGDRRRPGADLAVESKRRTWPPSTRTRDITARLVNRWTPFVATDGRQLRISATLEPVYELKGFTRIGFRMIRRVIVVATGEELTRAAGRRAVAPAICCAPTWPPSPAASTA